MYITVNSTEAAWNEANKLFPTDYMKDDWKSERAGYPVYVSTADENESWISDLNVRLELNIFKGKAIETTVIYIEEEPEIIEENSIDADDVRQCCIKNNLYTRGDVAEYNNMLNMASKEEYSLGLLYRIADDIAEHSEDLPDTEYIMYLLRRDAVKTFYTIKK